jgi:hypothetical protein
VLLCVACVLQYGGSYSQRDLLAESPGAIRREKRIPVAGSLAPGVAEAESVAGRFEQPIPLDGLVQPLGYSPARQEGVGYNNRASSGQVLP